MEGVVGEGREAGMAGPKGPGLIVEAQEGRRVVHGAGYEQQAPDIVDFLIVLDFDDLAGLQTYLQHPAHAELGDRFNQACSSGLIYDFDLVSGVRSFFEA